MVTLADLQTLEHAGRFEEARSTALRCLESAEFVERLTGALFLIASMKYELFGKALEVLKPQKEAFSNDFTVCNLLAFAAWASDEVDLCRWASQRCMTLNASASAGYLRLGMLELSKQRYAEAFAALSQGMSNCPRETSTLEPWYRVAKAFAEGRTSVRFKFDGMDFTFALATFSGHALESACQHAAGRLCEEEELRHVRQFVGQCDSIVEVGAAVGNHTVFFAKFLSPKTINVFDANADAVSQVRENAALNFPSSSGLEINVHHAAVCATPGKLRMCGREVAAVRLDDEVKQHVDFMKIDVDGMEMDVLEGCRGLITRDKPKVMIEVQSELKERFHAFLREVNYEVEHEIVRSADTNFFIRSLKTPAAPASNLTHGSSPAVARKKHVLLYTDDPAAGGVAQYNHSILVGLIQAGYRVSCMQSESENPLIEEQRRLGVSHHWIGYHTGVDFIRSLDDADCAKRIYSEDRPDLVVFSDCCPASNMAAREAAIASGIPYIIVIGFVGEYLAKNFEVKLDVMERHFKEAEEVIAVSQDNLDLLHRHFRLPPDRGRVIHYGRPAGYFSPQNPSVRARLRAELNLPAGAIVCFTAARLTSIKRFDLQLQAIHILHQNPLGKNLHFVWAGEGEQRNALSDMVSSLKLTGCVHFLGHRWDVADWHDASDIFLLPSEIEGMPLSIMEAMAKGLPVIATSVSGIPEELGDTGKLLPNPATDAVGVVRGLVETLAKWGSDANLRRAEGRRCRERAESMFREGLMLTRTLGVIADALSRERPVRRVGLNVGRAGTSGEDALLPRGKLKVFENREEMLAALPKGGQWAECGVFRGEFSAKILSICKPAHLYLIDVWTGVIYSGDVNGNNGVNEQGESLYQKVKKRYGADPRVSIIRAFSNVALAKLPDGSLDGIYVDADHSYEGSKRDLQLAKQKVKPGGWICGHDYLVNCDKARTLYQFGVRRAVDEFCRENDYGISALAMDGYVSFAIQKPV